MLKSVAVLAALALGWLASAQQVVLDGRHTGTALRPAGNLTVSTRSLASVNSQDEFLALSHPRFPAHQLRIKKTEFCDPTVK